MDWYKIGVTSFFILFLAWAMYHATQEGKRHGRK
jgi:hypothetical protein